MICYLKAKQHKGVKLVLLENLGKINILCGKNNSGKSSILEALSTQNKFGIGKMVEGLDWLCSMFAPQANNYSTPSPTISNNWFREHMQKLIDDNTVWYSDEWEDVKKHFIESQKQCGGLSRHREDIFNFNPVFNGFFEKAVKSYRPVLIPPKRNLDHQVTIETKEDLQPSGLGVVNHLFFLKNQDVKSSDYAVFKQIYDAFEFITGYRFNIFPDRENKITLLFSSDGSNWLPADMCGLGLSDVLVILAIVLGTDCTFVFIEEPENHLHAEYQKRLLRFLKEIKDKQFIITTHSNVFIDPVLADRILYVTFDEEVSLSDRTTKSSIIHSLGYSVTENLVADAIILTEGPTDIPILKQILSWLDVEEKYNVRYWPLGGDIMSTLDLSVFSERSNVFAFIDSDPGSSVQRTRFQRNCQKNNITCFRLERYSIENYFSLDAIRKVFPRQISAKLKILDPSISVDEQIGFKSAGKSIKGKNNEIIKEMALKNFEETDLIVALHSVRQSLDTAANDA